VIAFALLVRFSICELDADSLRRRIEENGEVMCPTSVSNRCLAGVVSA